MMQTTNTSCEAPQTQTEIKIKLLSTDAVEQKKWDDYVASSNKATSYHRLTWRTIIENSYGHEGFYLIAESGNKVVGILPLIKIKSRIFGKQLVSMPFVNYGGICAENDEVASLLLAEAKRIAEEHCIETIELRHTPPLRIPAAPLPPCSPEQYIHTKEHKVTMVLNLESDPSSQWDTFKPKVRNQVRKAEKSGLKASIGSIEDVDNFYTVFARNMRDLGSPTHSKKLFHNILTAFKPTAKIFSVFLKDNIVAASLVIGFKDTLEVPWASSIRDYISLCPNNLLYWMMIKYAIENGYKRFDFGRSTPGDGTYKFKKQWGAVPEQLYWQYLPANDQSATSVNEHDFEEIGFKRRLGEKIWRKMPLPLATWLGPKIRKQIPL